jgi:hypothetical protein
MMASYGKRLTRFAAAQTICTVQSGFCVFLGKAFFSWRMIWSENRVSKLRDHALRPRLQGKLNREWRVYRGALPILQSGVRVVGQGAVNAFGHLLISAAFLRLVLV